MRFPVPSSVWAAIVSVVILAFAPMAEAQAPQCDNRTFSAHEMSATFHTVNGQSILLLSGTVDENAFSRVASSVRQSRSYTEIWLCSPGGSVSVGKELGRAFSIAHATVRVPDGFKCVSSCTIAHIGGYLRLIDPKATFVIHASSSYMDLGRSSLVILQCSGGRADRLCGAFLSDLENRRLGECPTREALENPNSDCFYLLAGGSRSNFRQLVLSARYLPYLSADETTLSSIVDRLTESHVEYVTDLLQYYQEMLLDRRTDRIKSAGYSALRTGLRPLPLYRTSQVGRHSRVLNEDVAALNAASHPADQLALWQIIFTDMELNVQRQIVDFVLSGQVDLGDAGRDAAAIFDGMITCQIQSLCFLEQHQAEALGFRNFFDVQ